MLHSFSVGLWRFGWGRGSRGGLTRLEMKQDISDISFTQIYKLKVCIATRNLDLLNFPRRLLRADCANRCLTTAVDRYHPGHPVSVL